jgi:Spy/CpxP family protein refolding chaperone
VRRLALMLLLLVVPAAAEAQQAQNSAADQARRAALIARRDSLEAEIVQKFITDISRELRLEAAQRQQVEQVLRVSGERRRDLMRQSGELRGRIVRAMRDRATPDADFVRLLADHEVLRTREHDLFRRDQEDLSRILTPRQRLQFILQWAHFQEQVREILEHRMRDQRGGSGR